MCEWKGKCVPGSVVDCTAPPPPSSPPKPSGPPPTLEELFEETLAGEASGGEVASALLHKSEGWAARVARSLGVPSWQVELALALSFLVLIALLALWLRRKLCGGRRQQEGTRVASSRPRRKARDHARDKEESHSILHGDAGYRPVV